MSDTHTHTHTHLSHSLHLSALSTEGVGIDRESQSILPRGLQKSLVREKSLEFSENGLKSQYFVARASEEFSFLGPLCRYGTVVCG